MTHTVEECKKWIEDNREQALDGLSRNLPSLIKGRVEKIHSGGCWLEKVLKEDGANEQQVHDICFMYGQRCFGGDPYEVAVEYANQFVEGRITEKPGAELAAKINKEVGL